MNGIDVSSWQSSLNLNSVGIDFAIIKATQGTDYVNPVCDTHFQQGLNKGIKLGVYHFANHTDAFAEARYFYENTLGYVGKAIFVLDWEGVFVADVQWAKDFLDTFYSLSGVKPLIYMSESVVNSHDWSSVINGDYGLWVAKYADMDPDYGFGADKGTDFNVSWGAAGAALWQWTSRGRLDGYADDLDLNVFYGDRGTWDAYANVKTNEPTNAVETPVPEDTPEPDYLPTEPAEESKDNTPAPTTPTDEKPGDVGPEEGQPAEPDTEDTKGNGKPVVMPDLSKYDYDTEYNKIKKENTMKLNLPAPARVAVYILTALGTPVVAYLLVKGFIGPNEVALWSAEVTVASGIAALNVSKPTEEK